MTCASNIRSNPNSIPLLSSCSYIRTQQCSNDVRPPASLNSPEAWVGTGREGGPATDREPQHMGQGEPLPTTLPLFSVPEETQLPVCCILTDSFCLPPNPGGRPPQRPSEQCCADEGALREAPHSTPQALCRSSSRDCSEPQRNGEIHAAHE